MARARTRHSGLRSDTLVFGIRSYAAMAEAIARGGRWTRGEVEVREFPDGERYQRIVSKAGGRPVILVGGTISDADTLEMYDLACALVKYGAARLDLVVPYFGYSTMERAVRTGEVVAAKTRARLLSAIPEAPGGNRVFFLDLHSEGLPHYLEGGVTAVHVYGKALVARAARSLAGRDFVLASTDAGRAKWVQSLANEMGVPTAFIIKRRLDGGRTSVAAVGAGVEGRRVIIYDDMIRTGGSLLGAAEAYRAAGAGRIDVITTHGLFPGDALARLRESGLIGSIHASDSHPRAMALRDRFLKVSPVAPLFVQAIEERT